MEHQAHRVRAAEAHTFGLVGRALDRVELPVVEVRLPCDLADAAVAAWDRDDLGEVPETPEQRLARHRAGSLALIGLAVKERGRLEGDVVVVPLNAGLIASAVDASDDLPIE